LERRGTPAICVVTAVFQREATMQARFLGCPDARMVVIDHPLSTLQIDEVADRAKHAVAKIEDLFEGDSR